MDYNNPSPRQIVEWLPAAPADRRITYGEDAQQFGDLRIPAAQAGADGFPVVVLLHGGGYSPNWGLDIMAPLAERITNDLGYATWNLEYRRPGHVGGGWTGTWSDLAAGIDLLAEVASEYPLDLERVVLAGHSAGATFAAWAAARDGDREPRPPIRVAASGILLLAGILDLSLGIKRAGQPPGNLDRLLGVDVVDDPDEIKARLAVTSPAEFARSIAVPQRLIVGGRDDEGMIEQSRTYAASLASPAGDATALEFLADANHFDVIDPKSPAWPSVSATITDLVAGRP